MKEVKDNFLSDKEFKSIQDRILDNEFPWYYNVTPEKQFTHMFYHSNNITSNFFPFVEPLIKKIDPASLLKVKINLGTRTEKTEKSILHCDGDDAWGRREGVEGWYTSIFYLNTNNGYTYFEDGSKVKSIANRLVIFPCYMSHGGASCTDNDIRVVLNINYIK